MAHLLIASLALATLLSVIAVVLIIIPDRPDLRRTGIVLLAALTVTGATITLWP